jgi:hypothetical protein
VRSSSRNTIADRVTRPAARPTNSVMTGNAHHDLVARCGLAMYLRPRLGRGKLLAGQMYSPAPVHAAVACGRIEIRLKRVSQRVCSSALGILLRTYWSPCARVFFELSHADVLHRLETPVRAARRRYVRVCWTASRYSDGACRPALKSSSKQETRMRSTRSSLGG